MLLVSSSPETDELQFVWKWQKYDLSLFLFRAAFLVDLVTENERRVLKLNSISNGTQWKEMDVLIFDSWHWWLHTGRKQKLVKFSADFSAVLA